MVYHNTPQDTIHNHIRNTPTQKTVGSDISSLVTDRTLTHFPNVQSLQAPTLMYSPYRLPLLLCRLLVAMALFGMATAHILLVAVLSVMEAANSCIVTFTLIQTCTHD